VWVCGEIAAGPKIAVLGLVLRDGAAYPPGIFLVKFDVGVFSGHDIN
jgi:hypothetical protein